MSKKPHILYIHGGTTFKTRVDYLSFLKNKRVSLDKRIKWSEEYLDKKLGKDFDIVRPRMPFRENAKYEEWRIWFERYLPLLKSKIILVGESLGGIFLAKYLSENKLPRKAVATYLVCPPFDNTIAGEDLVGGFKLSSDLSPINQSTKEVNLMFSKDDPCVPISHADKYRKKLPNANFYIYENKNGHFNVPEFPEIVRMIKSDM